MKATISKGSYTQEEMEGKDKDTPGILDFCWAYINSRTTTELDANRSQLLRVLHLKQKQYIQETWLPKEHQVIRVYTHRMANLGCVATQRNEGFHNVVHDCTFRSQPLFQATRSLSQRIKEDYKQLAEDEQRAMTGRATGLDMKAFKDVKGLVSIYAIGLVEKEWLLANSAGPIDLNCACELPLRFSLPCRHTLQRCRDESRTIPLGIIHPRWWLNGPTAPSNWQPVWEERPLVISPKKVSVYTHFTSIIDARDKLNGEDRDRFNRQIQQEPTRLLKIASEHKHLSSLPIGMPDEVPKKAYKRKIPTIEGSRGLTALELQDHTAKKQRNEAAAQAKDLAIQTERDLAERTRHQYDIIQQQEALIEAQINRQKVDYTLLDDEVPVPNSSQLVNTTDSTPPPDALPPSTAPPRLVAQTVQSERPVRDRKRTKRKEEAVRSGLLKDSQGRV